MATSTPAHVTPEVLRWARESIGYDIETAAERIKVPAERLASAESGDALLTLRQAERAADIYDRPLASLFLPAPPDEEPQEAQFRRLPGAPSPPWPPEMRVLARRVQEKQEAAAELFDVLDEPSPWPDALDHLRVDLNVLPEVTRMALGVSYAEQTGWRDRVGYAALRGWVDAVEGLGVLVMQDGTLPVHMMRGFAAEHPTVPAIVVNTRDDARSRAFTVLHELGHLWLAATGARVQDTERWCEDFAGEVIMPEHWAERAFAQIRVTDPLARIDELAFRFCVTPLAAAVRVARYGLLPQRDVDQIIQRIGERPSRPDERSGGNYYRTQIGRMGPGFIRLVFAALDGQALTYPAASSLLETKASNFEKLRSQLHRRAAAE